MDNSTCSVHDPCPQHAVLCLECPCLPCWSAEPHAFKDQLKRPLATKLFLIHQNIITHLSLTQCVITTVAVFFLTAGVSKRLLAWVFSTDQVSLYQCMKLKSESEVIQSCPTLRPHGLQPTWLLHPWDFPGKSTGVGCHCLLWGFFLLPSI